MTENDLANKLHEMYSEGMKKREAVTMIHLFGIKYAKELKKIKSTIGIKGLLKIAKMSSKYDTEIYKGIRLATMLLKKDVTVTENDLANKLHEMYFGALEAKQGEATTMIHLFGIKHAKELEEIKSTIGIKELLKIAGMSPKYDAEVYKGIRLAKYVKPIDNA